MKNTAAEFIRRAAVSNTGRFHMNEEIADIQVVDACDLFTEHEQAFVRYDLETAWDDSEAFTVEVVVPLKEAPYMMVLEVAVDSVNELVTIERSRV